MKAADFVAGVSADGRYIFFFSNRSGVMSMWRMDSNGGNHDRNYQSEKSFSANRLREK